MKIIYTQHLEFRLKLREIPARLPKEIFQKSEERYFDLITSRKVAVGTIAFKGRFREMAVVYEEMDKQINLITIHPLKNYQKESRINSWRWQKI